MRNENKTKGYTPNVPAENKPVRRPEKKNYQWGTIIAFVIGYIFKCIQTIAVFAVAGLACVVIFVSLLAWVMDNPASKIEIMGGLYPALAITVSLIVFWLAHSKLVELLGKRNRK